MSRRILPLALIGGLALGGCASTHPTVASRPAENYDSASYHAVRAAYTPPAAERVDPLAHAIREVDESPDLDAALDAYSFGLTIDRDSLKLHKTFVRRMVDLGVPHLAAGAAAKVVAAEPDAPLARAVVAYIAGREGNMVDALTDITIAAKRAPNEPFIQRTSGHLLAWYDNNPRPPGLPSTVRFALQAMHESLDDKAVFADAYNDAADYYQARQAEIVRGPTTGPSVNPTTQPGVANGQRPDTLPPDEGPSYAGGGGPGGPIAPPPIFEPYGPPYAPYPYYEEPYVYSPWSFGWGPGFLVGAGFFVDFANNHHHHRRDFDRGHDRGHLANGDHGRTGDRGGRGGNGTSVGSNGTGTVASAGGGGHLAAVGRTGVFLPPPTGPRGVGSAAGKWVGRPTASVTGGFENLNTGVGRSGGFGSSLPRSNGYRARGTSLGGEFGGFSGFRSGEMSSGGSQGFIGVAAPTTPAPTGGIGVVPPPAPIVVPSAPSAPAARGGGGGRVSTGGGGHTSGGGGRR